MRRFEPIAWARQAHLGPAPESAPAQQRRRPGGEWLAVGGEDGDPRRRHPRHRGRHELAQVAWLDAAAGQQLGRLGAAAHRVAIERGVGEGGRAPGALLEARLRGVAVVLEGARDPEREGAEEQDEHDSGHRGSREPIATGRRGSRHCLMKRVTWRDVRQIIR